MRTVFINKTIRAEKRVSEPIPDFPQHEQGSRVHADVDLAVTQVSQHPHQSTIWPYVAEIVDGAIVNGDTERRLQLQQQDLDYLTVLAGKFLLVRCIQVDLEERFYLEGVQPYLVTVQCGGLVEVQIRAHFFT